MAAACLVAALPNFAWAARRVEAVPGKEYVLGKDNGPWMILVTSFRGPDARKYANDLVHELRSEYKLPAYIHFLSFNGKESQLKAAVAGRATPVRYRQYTEVAVLVGDYSSNDTGGDAHKALEKVKKIVPKSIPTNLLPNARHQQTPLRTAFVTKNPFVPLEQFLAPQNDRLVMRMNGGANSLFECPGQYSLLVARFIGTVTLQTAKDERPENEGVLAKAGEDAEELASHLRKGGLQAYTWHDRQFSIVTVGSFDSRDDHRADELRRRFAAQQIGRWKMDDRPLVVQVPKK